VRHIFHSVSHASWESRPRELHYSLQPAEAPERLLHCTDNALPMLCCPVALVELQVNHVSDVLDVSS
jgi:hypothetical protein